MPLDEVEANLIVHKIQGTGTPIRSIAEDILAVVPQLWRGPEPSRECIQGRHPGKAAQALSSFNSLPKFENHCVVSTRALQNTEFHLF